MAQPDAARYIGDDASLNLRDPSSLQLRGGCSRKSVRRTRLNASESRRRSACAGTPRFGRGCRPMHLVPRRLAFETKRRRTRGTGEHPTGPSHLAVADGQEWRRAPTLPAVAWPCRVRRPSTPSGRDPLGHACQWAESAMGAGHGVVASRRSRSARRRHRAYFRNGARTVRRSANGCTSGVGRATQPGG
jgi:hypothetical protein